MGRLRQAAPCGLLPVTRASSSTRMRARRSAGVRLDIFAIGVKAQRGPVQPRRDGTSGANIPSFASWLAFANLNSCNHPAAPAAASAWPHASSSVAEAIPGHRSSSSWMRAQRHWLRLCPQAHGSRANLTHGADLQAGTERQRLLCRGHELRSVSGRACALRHHSTPGCRTQRKLRTRQQMAVRQANGIRSALSHDAVQCAGAEPN